MARYQLVKAAGGVTASWTTNQASETSRPCDWSIVKRDFFFFLLHSVTTSGWQQSAGGKGEEIEESEMVSSVVEIHRKGKRLV